MKYQEKLLLVSNWRGDFSSPCRRQSPFFTKCQQLSRYCMSWLFVSVIFIAIDCSLCLSVYSSTLFFVRYSSISRVGKNHTILFLSLLHFDLFHAGSTARKNKSRSYKFSTHAILWEYASVGYQRYKLKSRDDVLTHSNRTVVLLTCSGRFCRT